MVLNQYSIFYMIAFLSAGITILLAFWALRFRYVPGSSSFAVMLMVVTLWTFSVGMGMRSIDIHAANTWIIVRMIGVIFSPLAWFIFVLDFTERDRHLNLKRIGLLSLIPLISTIMLISNPMHQLFIKSIVYVEHPPFLIDETWVLGPYFWVHFAYSYLLTLVGDYYMLREAYRLSSKYRAQAIALAVAAVIPLIFNVLFSFKLIPGLKVNYDPLGLVISGIIYAWAIFNYQLFDLSPVALRVLVDNMVDGMVVVDNKNRVVDINPAAIKIFGLSRETIAGKHIASLLPASINIAELLEKEQIQNTEFNLTKQDRTEYYELSISAILHRDNILGQLLTIREITSRKHEEIQLKKLAITDSLTGLSNHRHFYELLRAEFNRAIRLRHPLGLIMFDIDHFKKINDQHGHLVGDQILRDIAQVCQQELRTYDHFCRYGGEEFTVILPETDLEGTVQIAERLREIVVKTIFQTTGGKIRLTISLGASSLDPQNTSSVEQFVQQADTSLYRSKKEGRNRVSTWQDAHQ